MLHNIAYYLQLDLRTQGRRVVNLHDLHVRPVYWAYSGNGDSVRRAVWLQETGTRKRTKHVNGTETITLEYRYVLDIHTSYTFAHCSATFCQYFEPPCACCAITVT
jgi:hypothetical protein